jgi:hypothetical protein
MKENAHKLVIAVYVFGDYLKYVPYFVYGVNRSYPEYTVKIFVRERLTKEQKGMIPCEVIDGFDPVPQMGNIAGGFHKIVRWLIPYKYFKGFDYAYIGDVDMLLVREDPTLLEGHLKHMQQTGLCFSNQIRKGTTRLTGLHFFDVERYFAGMDVIDRCLKDTRYLVRLVWGCDRNEHFLYRLVKEGVGFGSMEKHITAGGDMDYRPHHGAHIGLMRGDAYDRLEAVPDYLDDMVRELGYITEIKKLTDYAKGLH